MSAKDILKLCLVALLGAFLGLWIGDAQVRIHQEQAQIVSEAPAARAVYDTTYLDQWCGEVEPPHTVRMIGAWFYSHDEASAFTVVEDESGNLWCVQSAIGEDDFLLLWIDNNATPDYLEDDEVVKVWIEAR